MLRATDGCGFWPATAVTERAALSATLAAAQAYDRAERGESGYSIMDP